MGLWLPLMVVSLYLGMSAAFWRLRQQKMNPFWAVLLLVFICQMHAVLLLTSLTNPSAHLINLSPFNVLSIAAWLLTCCSLLCLWQPQMVLVGVIIGAINAILVTLASFAGNHEVLSLNEKGVIGHIFISTAAGSVLTIACLHSVFYWYLFHRLKQKKLKNINMASLSQLERMTIIFIMLGWLLLLFSLFTGWLYVDGLFAAHLWQNTLLTLASFAVLSYLLHAYFWQNRGGLWLVRWLFFAYGLLLTGYVSRTMMMNLS